MKNFLAPISAALVAVFTAVSLQAAPPTTLVINNDRTEDVYIYFSGAPSITGTVLSAASTATATGTNNNNTGASTIVHGTSSVTANSALSLSTRTVTTDGGTGDVIQTIDSTGYLVTAGTALSFTLSEFNGGRVGFSVADPITDGTMAQFNNPGSSSNLGDYTKRYDKLEISAPGGNDTVFTDITATDFTSVPFTIATNDPASGASTAGWNSSYTSAINDIINKSVDNKTTNTAGSAIVTGDNGITAGGINDVIRVIAPSTAVAGTSPYRNIEALVSQLKTNANNINLANTDTINNGSFDLNGTLDSGTGDGVFTGTYTDTSTNTTYNVTLTIDASRLTTEEVYKADSNDHTGITIVNNTNPGVPVPTPIVNDIMRDFYSGLNIGAFGSATMITAGTFTGQNVGDLSTEELMQLASEEGIAFFFGVAQPGNPPNMSDILYNEYAELVSEYSDNTVYGFAYSDFLAGSDNPTVTVRPTIDNPTLTLTILGDNIVVPEPASGALLLGGGLLLLMRRRRR